MKLHDCLVHSWIARILDLDLNVRQFRDFPHQALTDRRRAIDEYYFHITIIAKGATNGYQDLSDIFVGFPKASSVCVRPTLSQQAMLERVTDKLSIRLHVQLRQNTGTIRAHCLDAEIQFFGDI